MEIGLRTEEKVGAYLKALSPELEDIERLQRIDERLEIDGPDMVAAGGKGGNFQVNGGLHYHAGKGEKFTPKAWRDMGTKFMWNNPGLRLA